MRVDWSPRALDELDGICDRAPRSGARILYRVEELATLPFPTMFRRVAGVPEGHVLAVPPYLVVYVVAGEWLIVVRILDGRRVRHLL